MKKKWLLLEGYIAIFTVFLLLWVTIPKFLLSQKINSPNDFPDPGLR